MSNIQKTLDSLQPYVIGIRYLEGTALVDVVFKDEQVLGSLDVEPEDVYMPLVSQYITLIQHNACNKGCKSWGCADETLCNDCTPQQCGPQK